MKNKLNEYENRSTQLLKNPPFNLSEIKKALNKLGEYETQLKQIYDKLEQLNTIKEREINVYKETHSAGSDSDQHLENISKKTVLLKFNIKKLVAQ